jgi:hypothetical protein
MLPLPHTSSYRGTVLILSLSKLRNAACESYAWCELYCGVLRTSLPWLLRSDVALRLAATGL